MSNASKPEPVWEGHGTGTASKSSPSNVPISCLTTFSPGARFDSESYSYGFSWSPEILEEWDWVEHFSPQPETENTLTLSAISLVCERISSSKLGSSQLKYFDDKRIWQLTDESGKTYTSRFLITGMGVLSNPTLPNVPGVSDYKGVAFHTARWPKENVTFESKRVGIIGTGATAIQAIPEIAKTAGSLTVFQRTPNWAIPLHNGKISKDEMAEIRKGYPELFERCLQTRMCFIHDANPDSIWEASEAERQQLWEHLYGQPGFGMWLSNYKEILVNNDANKLVSDFVANKIRQRVHDPETAETLVPKNHGFGTRRVPMETFYFEAYNRPNVRLIDLLKTPIERVTEKGVKTSQEEFEFDMLIYATGFDAVTGAFDAIDFTGVNGVKMLKHWEDGPLTQLGMTVHGFPNMFMIMGPHQAYGNIPRSIEYAVDWVSNCIQHLRANDFTRIEATEQGVRDWTEHVHKISEGLLEQ